MNWKWLFGGSVATLAGLKLYTDRVVRRAKATRPPRSNFVTIDGLRLHYRARGAGQPVVLLHGSGLVLQDFTLSIFDRVAATYQAVAFDRPGYGYSDAPADRPPTLALHARLLHAALRRLGLKDPILVGHSYGGSVALRYALDFPDEVAGLVLLAPAGYAQGLSFPPLFYLPELPVLGPLFLNTLAVPLWQVLTPLFVSMLFAPGPPPDGYAKMIEVFTVQPAHFRTYAGELTRLHEDLRAQSPRYGDIRVPVVIVAGAADRIAPPDDQVHPLQRVIPHARLVALKDAGHMVHHRQPEAVLAAIGDVHQQAGLYLRRFIR